MRSASHDGSSRPVLTFPLPTAERPAGLEEPFTEFERNATLYAATQGEIRDAKEAIPVAERRDAQELTERLRADETAVFTAKHETAARDHLAALEAKLRSLDPLADEAGNQLARVVGDVQGEWRERLEANRERTEAEFDAAMEAVAAAYSAPQIARNDLAWARDYQVDAALNPGYWRFPDVKYRADLKVLADVPVKSVIQRSDAHTYSVDGKVLVDALKGITDAPPEPITVPAARVPTPRRSAPATAWGIA